MLAPAPLACALLLAFLAPAAGQGLSPPWWVTFDMFQAALRPDRCLNISELAALPHKTEFRFNITVCAEAPEDKLVGLATFLTVRYDFGGQLFSSKVLDSRGKTVRPIVVKDGEQAMKLAGAALQGNHFFESIEVSSPLPCIDFYWVVFKPEIVQIWVDNLADLWGNINLLAADLFARVFRLEQFGVRATTLKFEDMAVGPSEQAAREPAAEAGAPGSSSSSSSTARGEQVPQGQQPGDQPQELPSAQSATTPEQQQQQDAELVSALWQRWQEKQLLRHCVQPGAPSRSRQLLAEPEAEQAATRPPGGRQGSSRLSTAAKCWALQLAKHVGGDAGVLRAQHWFL